MTADEYIARFAERAGVAPPTPEERETLLAMAGIAAHASERLAAPLCCWLAGRAGTPPDEARRIAADLAGA